MNREEREKPSATVETKINDSSATTDKEIITPSNIKPKVIRNGEKREKAKSSATTGKSIKQTFDSERLQRYSKGSDELDYEWDYFKH